MYATFTSLPYFLASTLSACGEEFWLWKSLQIICNSHSNFLTNFTTLSLQHITYRVECGWCRSLRVDLWFHWIVHIALLQECGCGIRLEISSGENNHSQNLINSMIQSINNDYLNVIFFGASKIKTVWDNSFSVVMWKHKTETNVGTVVIVTNYVSIFFLCIGIKSGIKQRSACNSMCWGPPCSILVIWEGSHSGCCPRLYKTCTQHTP